MINSRLVAFEILQSVLKESAYTNIAIDKQLSEIASSEKGFITRLVYGVVERKLTLDYLLNNYLKGRTKPKVKIILYIGTYQLLFMDKIPAHAAINETVELANLVGVTYYKNLINAVLHKIDANKSEFKNIDDLSIKYSCPEHLINMWKKMYGESNTIQILDSINNRAPIFAIPNKKFVDAEELQYELLDSGVDCELFNDAVVIKSSIDLKRNQAFLNGLFYIEDYSSYSAAKALAATDSDVVIDVCAAPGGKTFTLAQDCREIYSYDIYEHRVNLIRESAKRLCLDNIKTGINDAMEYNKDIPYADKILCDVPCSGFGIIRRKPEIRYKNLDSIKNISDIQYQILNTSSKYLKDGGRIVYSTCTLNKKENEKVVEKFLYNNPEYKLIDEVTVFPSSNGGDGFFYAVIERKND